MQPRTKNYQLFSKYGFVLFNRSTHIYSLYFDETALDIKIIYSREEGFDKTDKEISFKELKKLQKSFKDESNHPIKHIAHMNLKCSEDLAKVINDYKSIKEVFDNYGELKDSFKETLASKKSKIKKKL